jgi:hypothetical protein
MRVREVKKTAPACSPADMMRDVTEPKGKADQSFCVRAHRGNQAANSCSEGPIESGQMPEAGTRIQAHGSFHKTDVLPDLGKTLLKGLLHCG